MDKDELNHAAPFLLEKAKAQVGVMLDRKWPEAMRKWKAAADERADPQAAVRFPIGITVNLLFEEGSFQSGASLSGEPKHEKLTDAIKPVKVSPGQADLDFGEDDPEGQDKD